VAELTPVELAQSMLAHARDVHAASAVAVENCTAGVAKAQEGVVVRQAQLAAAEADLAAAAAAVVSAEAALAALAPDGPAGSAHPALVVVED
jgi:hypothetical protein